jgi:hypothetical protein
LQRGAVFVNPAEVFSPSSPLRNTELKVKIASPTNQLSKDTTGSTGMLLQESNPVKRVLWLWGAKLVIKFVQDLLSDVVTMETPREFPAKKP